jgi:hypothetical protein
LELYDVKNRKITITDNILFNSDILEKVQKNSTGSLLLYKATALGKNETQADIRCTFKLDNLTDSKYVLPNHVTLTVERHLRITQAVQISHFNGLILLPYVGNRKSNSSDRESWNLNAIGGSGNYDYEIKNTAVATVEKATLHSGSIGKT